MMNELMVYLKTTETCQLNCDHCFTNGSNGKKGWFDEVKTVDFFKRLFEKFPRMDPVVISFHGGEPMLCPLEKMRYFKKEIDKLRPGVIWSIQTNLTYKINDEKLEFLKDICHGSIGTSWDYNIRWKDNEVQQRLWEENVRYLVRNDIDVTVMVSLTDELLDLEPLEIIEYMVDLGIKYINFERITMNGNATLNPVQPSNVKLDEWLNRMWLQTVEHKLHEKVMNMFLESALTSILNNSYSGCRSRECEQKILTINADGRVGGCPNGAVENTFGDIEDDVLKTIYSEGRMCNINKETVRHDLCATCDVYDICHGDCHQLNWQGDVCASPKSMFRDIKTRPRMLLETVMGSFKGEEGLYPLDKGMEVIARG